MLDKSHLRALEDCHNELAHLQTFPCHYRHTDRFVRRVAVVARIRELRRLIVK